MSKIIILTHDDDNYENLSLPLGKALNNAEDIIDSYYEAFESIIQKKELENMDFSCFHKWLVMNNLFSHKIINLFTPQTDWKTFPEIPENIKKIRQVIDNHNEIRKPIYKKTNLDNGDVVFLLFRNRTKQMVNDIWQMMNLICKDCGIDVKQTIQGVENKHFIYIHDDEWSMEGNHLLMDNSEPKIEKNKDLLEVLKKQFKYAATFRHTNTEGLYFNNILNCKFGYNQFSERMGIIEDNYHITNFVSLKEEIIKISEKKKEI